MKPTAGSLLVATPILADPNFARTVILVVEYDESQGSLGVVLNRPTDIEIEAALPDWETSVVGPPVLFSGGPVEPSALLGLTRESGGGTHMAALEEGPGENAELRLFSGYAGWGPGQLEAEIAEQAWWVLPAEPGDAFAAHPETLWYEVLGRQRGRLSWYRHYPDDPALN